MSNSIRLIECFPACVISMHKIDVKIIGIIIFPTPIAAAVGRSGEIDVTISKFVKHGRKDFVERILGNFIAHFGCVLGAD